MVAKGLCPPHYQRKLAGKPVDVFIPKRSITTAERMAYYSGEPDENGCRAWQGTLNRDGYGVFSLAGGATRAAHRVAYELAGNVLDHRPIHHKCANRRCVEPSHLMAVSQQENTAEMMERQWFLKTIAAQAVTIAQLQERLRTQGDSV